MRRSESLVRVTDQRLGDLQVMYRFVAFLLLQEPAVMSALLTAARAALGLSLSKESAGAK